MFEIIGSGNEVPASLSLRSEHVAIVATSLLALSFFVIALARISSRQMMYGMFRAVYKNKQLEKIVQEEYSLNNLSSFFLIVNYVISGSAMLFLSLPSKSTIDLWMVLALVPIPFLMVFLPWFTLSFTGALTGEKNMVWESKVNTILFAHFTGLIYSLILLLWAFNMQWSGIFVRIFLGVTLFTWFYRFLRGFIFAFGKGAPWYYIILYFCTLEILPFALCYLVLTFKMEETLNWLLN